MSNTRYLEITSEYRNRNLYPLPGQFDVDISQTGTKGKIDALDPISNSTPLLIFNGSFDESSLSNTISGAVSYISDIGYTSATHKIVIYTEDFDFKPSSFYNGSVLAVNNGVKIEYRRIFAYERLTLKKGIITLDSNFSDSVQDGNSFNIFNPSDNTIDNTKIFIPYGSNADNYYINYFLEDKTISEFRKIISYDGTTHLATLEGSNYNVTWGVTDTYILRKEMPCKIGTLVNSNSDGITTSSFLLENNNINYTGDFLRIYTNDTDTNINIRRIFKYQTPLVNYIGLNSTNNVGYSNIYVNINNNNTFNFNLQNSYYNGFFITIDFGGGIIESRLITLYKINYTQYSTISSLQFECTPEFTQPLVNGTQFTVSGGIVYPNFDIISINNDKYEILCFSRDNAVPFNYTGSTISQQEEVCYEIELLDLVLPNQTLIVGKGSRITFYPYVYVELSNVSAPGAGQRGILYSNNPNSTKMLFRCPIDDIPNPIISPFIKIDGDGAVQTIKFKINDNLRFSVRLPNGEIFQTNVTENYSPLPPNPISQISALFSLKRL